MSLTDEQIKKEWSRICSFAAAGVDKQISFARAIESAATAPLLERIKELEALRKDAERYRWLKANCGFGIRKNGVNELSVAFYEMQPDNINELDASIDAAKESS